MPVSAPLVTVKTPAPARAGELVLEVSSQKEALEPARLAIQAFLSPFGPSERARFHVELVLEESLMNVIWHGFSDGDLHLITVRVAVSGEDIVLQFEDEGREFDPTQAPDPALPSTLAEATPGGLGLMLVRKFARSVQYRRVEAQNILTIRIAR
jgi:anti-sigma regulatory factor (Ser/Thr protein kinase)